MTLIKSAILVFFLTINGVSAENLNPEDTIKEIFKDAGSEKMVKDLKHWAQMDARFNFQKMSLSILGDESKKRTAEDLRFFEKSIKEIITKTVYPKAPEFLKNVKITYKKTNVNGDKAVVASVVSKKGERTDVNYFLEKETQDSGEWRVVDVSIDDESWVKTIKSGMDKSFKEKGWKGVVELLNKKLKELNKKS